MDDIEQSRLRRDIRRLVRTEDAPTRIPSFLGRVVTSAPAVDRFILVQPLSLTGSELEGSTGIVGNSGSTAGTTAVYLMGPGVPNTGDELVCRHVDYRWVAHRRGSGGGGSPCGQICVTVKSSCSAGPLKGCTITITTASGTVIGTGTTDSTGLACIPINSAGSYTVSASMSRFATRSTTITATCTTNNVTVTLSPSTGYYCVGNCTGAYPGLTLTTPRGNVIGLTPYDQRPAGQNFTFDFGDPTAYYGVAPGQQFNFRFWGVETVTLTGFSNVYSLYSCGPTNNYNAKYTDAVSLTYYIYWLFSGDQSPTLYWGYRGVKAPVNTMLPLGQPCGDYWGCLDKTKAELVFGTGAMMDATVGGSQTYSQVNCSPVVFQYVFPDVPAGDPRYPVRGTASVSE